MQSSEIYDCTFMTKLITLEKIGRLKMKIVFEKNMPFLQIAGLKYF